MSDVNWLSIIVIINNYFHDLATGLLLCSAVILGVLGRQARRGGAAEQQALARAYPTLRWFALVAFAWILLGGVPRTIFFTRYEWDPAVLKGIVPALMVKHVFMVSAIVVGAVMWFRVARIARTGADEAGSEHSGPGPAA